MLAAPSRYRAPGVYVEWLDANAQQLELARTDVAGFVGIAERGPLHRPRKIESMRQFVTTFGGHVAHGFLAYAVEGFFANGGRTCWVVRVADPSTAKCATVPLRLPDGREMVLEAVSPGAWGNGVRIEAVWDRDRIVALSATEEGRPSQRIALDRNGHATARGAHATLLDEPDRTPPELAEAQLVRLALGAAAPSYRALNRKEAVLLQGGDDGVSTLELKHFSGGPGCGIDALARIDRVSFVAAPDLMCPKNPLEPALGSRFELDDVRDAQIGMLARCMQLRDRIALLDLPRANEAVVKSYLSPEANDEPRLIQTSFAAAYHPWIAVEDPLRLQGNVRQIPPSGHVAGMLARTDRLRGVHKAPGNETLERVLDLYEDIDEDAHARLNEACINAIRAIPGRGVLVLGARTLDDETDWRYINVRRLFAMIEEALDEQLQWLTFEPNNPHLWREIDRAARGFLERLFRLGMLDGATSEEAYFVRCDETTNPPEASDGGRVICELGLQPPWPAEFVVVRIGVTAAGIQVEDTGARNG